MSNFAVGFYEVLYKEMLGSKILSENGEFTPCLAGAEGCSCTKKSRSCFAGDTMNSFNSIANLVGVTSTMLKDGSGLSKLPQFLLEYYSQYHCLANFWLIPSAIGRTGLKKIGNNQNSYDSMDLFLNGIKDEFSMFKNYQDYYEKVKTYEDFCRIHFIEKYEYVSSEEVMERYSCVKPKKAFLDHNKEKLAKQTINAEVLVSQAMRRIKDRATVISESKHAEALWEYFKDLGLID